MVGDIYIHIFESNLRSILCGVPPGLLIRTVVILNIYTLMILDCV